MSYTDAQIREKLEARTDEELISFRQKLKKIDTPAAWGIRFQILKVITSRVLNKGLY